MSRISTNRTSQPSINMNMPLGKKPLACAVPSEVKSIRAAIAALSKAEHSQYEKEFLANITEAFKLCRNITRSRIL